MSADAFREALGSGRGATARQLAEELRQVREENAALREAATAQGLAASRMRAAVEKMEEKLRDALTDKERSERELLRLAHMLEATQYLALHQLNGSPKDEGVVWYDAAAYSSYPFYSFRPKFQGDFSHRRPYLRRQLVRDVKYGYFVALGPLPPSRTRPHADAERWEPCEPDQQELVLDSCMRETSAILRRAPVAPENESCEELKGALEACASTLGPAGRPSSATARTFFRAPRTPTRRRAPGSKTCRASARAPPSSGAADASRRARALSAKGKTRIYPPPSVRGPTGPPVTRWTSRANSSSSVPS